jgi:hypothetical protein
MASDTPDLSHPQNRHLGRKKGSFVCQCYLVALSRTETAYIGSLYEIDRAAQERGLRYGI